MPETTMPPGAAFVIAIILLCAAGFVLVLVYKVLLWHDSRRVVAPRQSRRRARPALPRRLMSRSGGRMALRTANDVPIYAAKLNAETTETPQRVAENSGETFTFAETQALARLVAAGKLGLTDAVKIGADAKSGEKYQKRSQEIKAAVAQLQEKYPRQTPEQTQLRKELGIGKP